MKPPAGIFPCCDWKEACNCNVAHLKILLIEDEAPRLSPVRSDWLSPFWMDLQRWRITVMPVCPGPTVFSVCRSSSEPLFYDPHGGNEMEIRPLSEVLWWMRLLLFIVLRLVLPALLYLHQLPPALCMSSSPLRHSNRTSDAVSWFSWVAEFIPFKSNPRKHQQGCNIKSFYLCLAISRVFWEPHFCSNNPVECLPG